METLLWWMFIKESYIALKCINNVYISTETSGQPIMELPPLHHRRKWWRHQMETFSALLALCEGNSPVTGEFPSQGPDTRSFDILFHLHLKKRLSKQRDAGDLGRNRAHYDATLMNCSTHNGFRLFCFTLKYSTLELICLSSLDVCSRHQRRGSLMVEDVL